jgi:hypothetical protein
MGGHEHLLTQPLFYLFIVMTLVVSYGYFWGRRKNKEIFLDAFNDLVRVVQPDDQTFTNIGGAIGYHANLFLSKKSPVKQVDATITLLPRHAWLYMPISKLIMRHDRLFITFYLRHQPPGEGHLIETKYASFRGPKITNAERLHREDLKWGNLYFSLYYDNLKMHDHLKKFMDLNPDPGILRHIAVVPDERKGFVFAVPRKKQVGRYMEPVYRWLPTITGN